MKNKNFDILKELNDIYGSLTNTQQKIADYLLSNLNIVAFETLENLALKIGVSTTSIIRIAKILGFSGYSEFQRNIQDILTENTGLPERLSKSNNEDFNNGLLKSSFEMDIINLRETLSLISKDDLLKSIELINKASTVYILGLRGSFSLAYYLSSRLSQVRKNVHLIQSIGSMYPEEIINANKKDICISFLFPRYSRTTISILSSMKDKNVENIIITSPSYKYIENYASIILPCKVESTTFKDSFVAPMSLSNYIVESIIQSNKNKAMKTVSEIEQILSEGFYLGL